MDNIITGQQALETKLDLVNQQVQSNEGEIEQLKKTADFVSEQLTKADPSLADRTALSPQQVTDLLRMCLTTTYFKYDGNFYAQIEGAAMGSPVIPIVANLFMDWRIMRAKLWKHTTTHPNIGAGTLMTSSQ